ncbi:STAS-like domain-containing protein [Paenibacillus barengoltzii]|uniref:STAS-like domain-containing protein n=1 Tax=Paenibacillus barengoltzii TaxID=343517 RepID=UPI000FDC445D|nr:DUF4325 domain-containing protein [Paenibacillus barengoltzii]MEC2343999.1 DUF4325 domain-containing protein [Paenibacillus barengoltzii]
MFKIGIDKNKIYMKTDRLNWAATLDIKVALFELIIKKYSKLVILDLGNVTRVYPNGVLPIVTELDRFRRKGIKFQVIPPKDLSTRQYMQRLNWLYYLDPDNNQSFNKNNYQNFALHSFDNSDQLDEVINNALEICMKQLVFAEGVPQAFEWTINEIAGNILVHAGIETGYLQVLVDKEHHKLILIVCDSGVGIPYNIQKAFPEYHSDRLAIEHAIKKGVTSNPKYGQGNGLAGSVAIAVASNSSLFITSGKGRVQVIDGRIRSERHYPKYFGTCVELQFNTQIAIDLPKALWGHIPANYMELNFESEQGDLIFKLTDHSSNFGNRPAGERIRNLVMNLLVQNQGKTVSIDMDEIGVVASSFADELFGKLAVELGMIDFNRLIRIINVNPVCKKIVDEALVQRIVQSYGMQNITLVKDFS